MQGSWEYETPDGSLKEFSRTSNGTIELAFQQKHSEDIELMENDVTQFTVSLSKMTASYDDEHFNEQVAPIFRRSAGNMWIYAGL